MSKFTNMQKYWQQLRWSLYNFKRQINITDCNSPCETMCYWFMFIAHHYLYLLCLQNEMKRVAGLSSLNNLTHFDDISALTEGRAPQVLHLHCFDISLSLQFHNYLALGLVHYLQITQGSDQTVISHL